MTGKKKHILILPRWYPNVNDIQLGVFIKRQAILMTSQYDISVIYVQSNDKQKNTYSINKSNKNGLNETIIYFKKAKGPLKKLTNLYRYINSQRKGYKLIKSKPDLTHIHVPYKSAIFALWIKRKYQVPFSITEHWSGHLNGQFHKYNALDKALYKYILKQAKKISTVSQALQIAFKKNTGIDTEIIPNYIEKVDQPVTKRTTNTINILSVADFNDEVKNITGLLHSFKKALSIKPNLHLTLIGGGPDEEKIKKLIGHLQFNSNQLTLTGRLDHSEVLIEMGRIDFYICNSRYETFGMTIAESLINGTPVISTPCGGPDHFLNTNNSITLSSAHGDNREELTAAILKMSDTYNDYNKAQIKKEIENQFGEKAVIQKWVNFYS